MAREVVFALAGDWVQNLQVEDFMTQQQDACEKVRAPGEEVVSCERDRYCSWTAVHSGMYSVVSKIPVLSICPAVL